MVSQKEIEMIYRLNEAWQSASIKVEKMGGKTNRNFRVSDNHGDWFVRIPYEGLKIVDRVVELQNCHALRRCKAVQEIVPRCHFYLLAGRNCLAPCHLDRWRIDLPDGTMVTEYIEEGKELNVELLRQEKVQERVVSMLHLFHTSGVNFVNPYDPFQDEIAKYKKQVMEREEAVQKLAGRVVLAEVKEVEQFVAEKLPEEGAVCTHNDLNFGNFLLAKNGRIFLLDFEYAGCNTRGGLHYDFGTLLGENMFYREGRNPLKINLFEEILRKASVAYKKDFSPDKAYCGALTNVLLTFWWGLLQYFNAETKERREFFADWIHKRIQGIRQLRDIVK